jgi:Ala-tRNA(Pro) deacylase
MYPQTLIKKYLDLKHVPYEHRVHDTAYTAQDVAEQERIPGTMVAKTVVIKMEDDYAMVVVPASARVDLASLKRALGVKVVRLATEHEFMDLFPDSDVGAMPPFGNLYGLPVYVEDSLTRDLEIVFNAGTHQDTIRMKYQDFARLVKPQVYSFALARAA